RQGLPSPRGGVAEGNNLEKIYIIDYVGQSDDLGKPVGHPVKAVKEAVELLAGAVNVGLIMPRNYEAEFNDEKNSIKFFLKYHSKINISNFFNRAASFWGKISNLMRVFRNVEEGILWFINPDFLLYVFMCFFPFLVKKKRKIVLTLYMEGFGRSRNLRGRVKDFFFRRAIHKVDLVMKNSEKISVAGREVFCHTVVPGFPGACGTAAKRLTPCPRGGLFYPDYIYSEDKYKQYRVEKQDYILCAGLMNRARDLLTLIDVYRRSGIELKLKMPGYFPDKNLLREALECAAGDKRIEIVDAYLNGADYYREIAGARFSILPYKKSSYFRRTSGLLLESIFLDTPVIAPAFLLEFTGLPGIAYEKLEDMEKLLAALDKEKLQDIEKQMKESRASFARDKVRERIVAAFAKL
ncbi:MAG: hypothetical protein KAW12_09275, partial [Candidatus Aminicenantes bacterium]|nr:hypothetical protein [Candidatus Aminicenantes bacterium]